MEVTYNLEPNDLVQFNRFWWRRKSSVKSWLFMLGILTLVLVLSAPILVGLTRPLITSSWPLILWFFLMLIILPLLLPPLYRFLVGRTARATPGFVGLHTMAINPAGLTQKTAVAETKVQWPNVADITEDDALIYVFLSQSSAFMIPKRCFAQAEDAWTFLQTAREYWKNTDQALHTSEGLSAWPPPPQTLGP